jgi:D-beta-D-heptose 7-phosphate kinase/D-beta-D-heptose 1-phosphate adenosyltransferase
VTLLTRPRVDQLITGFAGKRILVVGDVMLDQFIWGKVQRISPEAPVPIVDVSSETYLLGGAANVAANVRVLEGEPVLIGIIGKDAAAAQVQTLVRKYRLESSGLLADNRPTTLKTRIMAHSQQIVRADRESRAPVSAELNKALADEISRWLPSSSAMIVSDYDKGLVNRQLLSMALPLASRANIPVFLDPKVQHADYYRPITLITPNQREAELLTGMSIGDQGQLEEAGRRLLQKFECPYALITRGEEGMSLFFRTGSRHFPTVAREVFDVTGAGDTVIATLALAAAGGATMEEAAVLANHAAGLVVGKVGTATINRAELLADFDSRDADPSS